MTIPIGRHTGIPAPDYHTMPCVTYGVLRAVSKCPAKAQLMLGRRAVEPSSDVERLGIAIHCAILEPDRFEFGYVATTCQAMLRNKHTRCNERAFLRHRGEWYCRLHARDLEPDEDAPATADEREIEICKAVRKRFQAHSGVRELLGVGLESEVSLIWKDPATGLDCKCRPDLLALDGTIAVDLKSTAASAHPLVFGRRAVQGGYLHQAAFTRMACRELAISLRDYYIIALETNEPYCVAAYRIREGDIDWAEEELHAGLRLLSDCLASGQWPAYEGIQDLVVPNDLKGLADSGESSIATLEREEAFGPDSSVLGE
jgi:hypothetical protein